VTAQARLAYWSGIVLVPLVFLGQLSLAYALVPWACRTQHDGVLHAVSALALALSLAGLYVGWREWTHVRGRREAREDAAGEQPRFLTLVALAIGALFTVAVVGVWFTQWVLGPCLA
jgi:hypothetical protein